MQTISMPLILITSVIFLVACQTDLETTQPASEIIPELELTAPALPQPVSSTPGEIMTLPTQDISGMESLIALARNHLARKLSISVDEIHLVEARPVVWPDSSMGCPQPGMAYLQIPEDGALIVLEAHEVHYRYHQGGNRELFLCENASHNPALTPGLDLFNLTPSGPPPITPDNSIPPGEDT